MRLLRRLYHFLGAPWTEGEREEERRLMEEIEARYRAQDARWN